MQSREGGRGSRRLAVSSLGFFLPSQCIGSIHADESPFMTPLDLEHRLRAIETAFVSIGATFPNLMETMIAVLEHKRADTMAVDNEADAFALHDLLKAKRDALQGNRS